MKYIKESYITKSTIICPVCHNSFDRKSGNILKHLKTIHQIEPREFYLNYFEQDSDTVCLCGKEKHFKNITDGFAETCGDRACISRVNSLKNTGRVVSLETRKKQSDNSWAKDDEKRKKFKDLMSNKFSDKEFVEKRNEKSRQTNTIKYGVEHYSQTENHKQSMSGELNIMNDPNIKKIHRKAIDDFLLDPQRVEQSKEKSKHTCIENYGVEHYWQSPKSIKEKKEYWNSLTKEEQSSIIEKRRSTNIEKYDVGFPFERGGYHEYMAKKIGGREYENVSQIPKIREKIEESCVEKYGVKNPTQNPNIYSKVRKTNEDLGNWTELEKLPEFIQYRRVVNNKTRKFKKKLFESWDGYDYYSKEYIRDIEKKNITIDHKNSIYYGFHNNILPDDIAKLENLCITIRNINSKKNRRCENEFNH